MEAQARGDLLARGWVAITHLNAPDLEEEVPKLEMKVGLCFWPEVAKRQQRRLLDGLGGEAPEPGDFNGEGT